MMEKMMAKMMGKENMPKMMEMMMEEMFKNMNINDKIDFIGKMIPLCIGNLFAKIEKEDRIRLATAMIGKLKEELEKQIRED